MKRIITFIALAATIFFSYSCKEDSIDVFGEQNFLQFTQPTEKPYRFSFATTPGKNEHTIVIPLTLIGRELNQDKEYTIEIVKDGELKTTASSSTFSLPKPNIFRKGLYQDTLYLKLINGDELKSEKTLVISIKEDNNFKPGIKKNQQAVIYFSNIIAQPDWWDKNMSNSVLGEYSDIKYQQLIIATGISDFNGLNVDQMLAYIRDFIYYLRRMDNAGTPIYEKDGKTKVEDSIPYAKNV